MTFGTRPSWQALAVLLPLARLAFAAPGELPESFVSPGGVVLASDLIWPENVAARMLRPRTTLERDLARHLQPGEARTMGRPGEAQTKLVAAVLTRWKRSGGLGARREALTRDWRPEQRRLAASSAGLPDQVAARLMLELAFGEEIQAYGMLQSKGSRRPGRQELSFGDRAASLAFDAATGEFRSYVCLMPPPKHQAPVRSAAFLRARCRAWFREHRGAAADWPVFHELHDSTSHFGVTTRFLLRPSSSNGVALLGVGVFEITERGWICHASGKPQPVQVSTLQPRYPAAKAGAAALASIRNPTADLVARGWLPEGRPEAKLGRVLLEVYRQGDGQRLVWTCFVESQRYGGMTDYVRVDALTGELLSTTVPLAATYRPPRQTTPALPPTAAPAPPPARSAAPDRAREVQLGLLAGLILLLGWLVRRSRP